MVPSKRAECAFGRTDVRVVDIPVDDVSSVILRMHSLRSRQRPAPQILHRSVVIKLQGLGVAEASPPLNHRVDIERKAAHRFKVYATRTRAPKPHSLLSPCNQGERQGEGRYPVRFPT